MSDVYGQGNISHDVGSDAGNDENHFKEAGQGVDGDNLLGLSREQLLLDAVPDEFILGT